MAKKAKNATQQNLVPDLDDIPRAVKTAATKYKTASVEASQASATKKSAKDNLIDKMKEHGIQHVKVTDPDGIEKLISAEEKTTVKEKVYKGPVAPDAEEA